VFEYTVNVTIMTIMYISVCPGLAKICKRVSVLIEFPTVVNGLYEIEEEYVDVHIIIRGKDIIR
jgi:hypothetical protein